MAYRLREYGCGISYRGCISNWEVPGLNVRISFAQKYGMLCQGLDQCSFVHRWVPFIWAIIQTLVALTGFVFDFLSALVFRFNYTLERAP